MPFFDILIDLTCFLGWKWISIITIPLFLHPWQNKPEIKFNFDRTEKGSFFDNFSSAFTSSCQVEGHGGTLSIFSLNITKIFPLCLNLHARWKGTGEPCSKFFSKVLKNFPGHFWKILCFLKSLYSPLSYGIWILVRHPLVETLVFLEHSGLYFCGKV